MRSPRIILFAMAIALGITAPQMAWAKKAKGGKGGGSGATPPAAELAKLKAIRLGDPKAGLFTWGMNPDDVFAKAKSGIEARYQDRIDGAKADPGKQQRIRDEREKEIKAVKASFTKFEGQKSGWDVSIIGSEFMQNNGEAVIQIKEDVWTRYFFFFEDQLYKMYLAFNKDVIGDKSFRDFGKEMAAKYGNPREVYRDEKQKGGMKRVLDHFEWAVSGTDALKLVDRSEFYGVYCLILSNAQTTESVMSKRKITNPGTVQKDALVEAVVNDKESANDSNEDIIDRVTGHEVKKPGDEMKHGNIVVPSPSSSGSSAPPPASKSKSDKSEKKGSGSGIEL
ncbi:MAG TPA: hypothetical protein VGP07_23070 [Polyangia bacterium]|jgi:hypothetical protein